MITNRFKKIHEKKILVILMYVSYIYLSIVSTLLIHESNIINDENNTGGMILLIFFTMYVIWQAIVEAIGLYRTKSYRMIIYFFVILISYLIYFSPDIKYIYLLVLQVILVITLFLNPFFAVYENQTDENKRVLAYKYMYSQFIVFYFYIAIISKFQGLVLYLWITVFIYLIFQYSYKNVQYFIKTTFLIVLLLVLAWLSSNVIIQNGSRVYSFDLIFIILNFVVLYVLMSIHRKFFLFEIKKFETD